MARLESIIADNKDGTVSNTGNSLYSDYLDRTLVHELTHAVMRANINYFSDLPSLIKECLADLTIGPEIKEYRKMEILLDIWDSENLMLKNAFSYEQTDPFHAVTGSYVAGYMLLRYLAKQISENVFDHSREKKLIGGSNINGNKGNDTIYGGFGNDTFIYASGDGNDVIINYTPGQNKICK